MKKRLSDNALADRLRAEARPRLAELTGIASPVKVITPPSRRGVLARIGMAAPLAAAAALALVVFWDPLAGEAPRPHAGFVSNPSLRDLGEQVSDRWEAWQAVMQQPLVTAERSAATASAAIDHAPPPAELLGSAGRAIAEPYRREWQALGHDLNDAWRRITGRHTRQHAPDTSHASDA